MARTSNANVVGQRVRVFWNEENEWFSGRVQAVDERDGYYVVYDDGDERWEPPTQLLRFDDDNDAGVTAADDDEEHAAGVQERVYEDDGGETGGEEEEEQQVAAAQPRSSRAPQMLEPPASPIDDDYDAYDDDDDHDDGNDNEDDDPSARGGGDEAENEDERGMMSAGVHGGGDSDDDDLDARREPLERSDSDDGEQSIALSEVPITFERLRGRRTDSRLQIPATARSSGSKGSRSSREHDAPLGSNARGERLPASGVLRGRVLSASNLPSSTTRAGGKLALTPPRAFVKVAFVEAGDGAGVSASSLMLRCKNALASTSVAAPSCSPVWNEPAGNDGEVDGEFQIQLAPPQAKAAPSAPSKQPVPPWLQLRGDVLFSVYASSELEESSSANGGGRSHRQAHDFVGQAALSLPDILREALFVSPTLVRRLSLQSRQGKSLGPSWSSSMDGDDAVVDTPELVIALEFEPAYSEEVRQRAKVSAPTLRRPASARAQPKSTSQQSIAQQKASSSKHTKRPHTSSSAVNRRRFEKQIDQQNVAFAKRIEWQHERRARVAEHAKAQAKSRFPVPQHGTMKRDHKASSGVNRGRLQQQIHGENRAMEKRLHAIALKSGGGDSKRSRADAKGYDVGFDDLDKDKLLACDRREQKLREHDFVLARAQATYRKQNAAVEEVLALQADVAELRAQVFAAKASANRLDALTSKDEHLCKCLRAAAETSALSSASGALGAGSMPATKRRNQRAAEDDDCGSSSDADVARQRKELELLKREAASLDADVHSRSQEFAACNQRAQELDDEVHRLSAQLRFARSKQAFQLRMSSKAGAAEQRLAQDMKQKTQRLELSRDDEEQWQLFQAQQELAQLQIAVQVLKQRQEPGSVTTTATATAACEYLQRKIARQQQKLAQLETEQRHFQREYEALVISGEQDALRSQVHELQQTLFLCQAQHKQLAAAQRHARFAGEKLATELRKQAFEQQTETDVLLARRR